MTLTKKNQPFHSIYSNNLGYLNNYLSYFLGTIKHCEQYIEIGFLKMKNVLEINQVTHFRTLFVCFLRSLAESLQR